MNACSMKLTVLLFNKFLAFKLVSLLEIYILEVILEIKNKIIFRIMR